MTPDAVGLLAFEVTVRDVASSACACVLQQRQPNLVVAAQTIGNFRSLASQAARVTLFAFGAVNIVASRITVCTCAVAV